MHERITVHAAPTEQAEAEFVVATIERLIGGHSFFSIDSGRAGIAGRATLSFSDFAVLYRTDGQSAGLVEALARSGMPFKQGEHARLLDTPAVRALVQALDEEADDAPLAIRLTARPRASRRARASTPLRSPARCSGCRSSPSRAGTIVPASRKRSRL